MKKAMMLASVFILTQVGLMAYAPPKNKDARKKNWHVGMILLKNGEMLSGKISYHYKKDIVRYKAGDRMEAYTPHQVKMFRFYDESFDVDRVYYNLKYELENGYERHSFYEILKLGKIPLLGRLKFAAKNADQIAKKNKRFIAGNRAIMKRYTFIYEYYIMVKGELIAFQDFNKEIWPLMMDKEEEMREYRKKNSLRLNFTPDQVELVKHYNSLEEIEKVVFTELVSLNEN